MPNLIRDYNLRALRRLPQAERAKRVVEIVKKRHPHLKPDSVLFGAKAMALDLLIDLKETTDAR